MIYCRRHHLTARSIMQNLCIVWQLLVLATVRMEVFLRQVALAKVVTYIWEIDCRFILTGTMKILHAVCHLHHQRQIMIDTLWECHHRLCRHITIKNTSSQYIIDQCHQVLGNIFGKFCFLFRFELRRNHQKVELRVICSRLNSQFQFMITTTEADTVILLI